MLVVKNITKTYGNLNVLKGIDLQIHQGEVASIVGASGAGKSTLLHIAGTLDKPDTGQVFIAGQEITNLKDTALAKFRNEKLGFIFQFHNLLGEFTALENVCMPAYIGGKKKKKKKKKKKV
eukprot:Opistho-1_new@22913